MSVWGFGFSPVAQPKLSLQTVTAVHSGHNKENEWHL